MLTEARQEFAVDLLGCEGGFHLMPSPRGMPKAHGFQGQMIYSRMLELEGRVASPKPYAGKPMRIWLSRLERWHFERHRPAYIGDILDRSEELPGGGLEAVLYIPKDAWPTSTICLGGIWRHLRLSGVDGDGHRMTVVALSFSADS